MTMKTSMHGHFKTTPMTEKVTHWLWIDDMETGNNVTLFFEHPYAVLQFAAELLEKVEKYVQVELWEDE